MKNTALITGASNGIGLELAKIHTSKGGDLVLVAWNTVKLEELETTLESQYNVAVHHIIGIDISLLHWAQEIHAKTSQQNIQIDYLINNVGFGDYGMFAETDWNREGQMINLNMTTLTLFTKLYLQDMMKRGSGKIMNVESTAAFQSGPTMAKNPNYLFLTTVLKALTFPINWKGHVMDSKILDLLYSLQKILRYNILKMEPKFWDLHLQRTAALNLS